MHEGLGDTDDVIHLNKFFETLSSVSTIIELSHIVIGNMDIDFKTSMNVANALTRVKSVELYDYNLFDTKTFKQFVNNITMKRSTTGMINTLLLWGFLDFSEIMEPTEFVSLIENTDKIVVGGKFTFEQIKAVTTLPDVTIEEVIDLIPDEEFYYISKK